jgi:glycosyltransferase involved in cell wall biosynthesis
LRAYHVDPDRCEVIYKAVDVDRFARNDTLSRDPFPQRKKGLRLVFVGSNWEIKGLDILLLALEKVRLRYPDVSLLVAGSKDNIVNNKIKKLALEKNLDDIVIFAGQADRHCLTHFLWHSDIFVLPSRQEALGVAAIEAMSAGLPVIAAQVGGLTEIVRSPDEGMLFEVGDVDGLCKAISKLADSEETRLKLSVNGLRRSRDFNVHRMVERVRRLYREIQSAG